MKPSQEPTTPSPRAFAQGTGYVFTIIGLVLMLGGCCIGSFSGIFQGEQPVAPRNVTEWVHQSPRGQLLAGLDIVITGAAGLALMTFGVGLQQERRGSGTWAVITTSALALGWWGTTIASIWHIAKVGLSGAGGPIGVAGRLLVQIALTAGATLLVMMAAAARRNLKLNPPPPDEPVTEEFLAQFRRRRHSVEED